MIKVQQPKQVKEKKDFVICLKEIFLPYDDKSLQLSEWLEIYRLLGVDKAIIYTTGKQHPNMSKELRSNL